MAAILERLYHVYGYAAYSVKLGGDVAAFNEFYQLAPRRLIIVYEQKLLACCVVIPSAAALVARVVGVAAPFSDGNVKRRGLAIIFYLYRGVGKRKLGAGGVGIIRCRCNLWSLSFRLRCRSLSAHRRLYRKP